MNTKRLAIAAALAACLTLNADDYAAKIDKLVAEDVAKPVRPYGVDGQDAFWNTKAISFMYPPVLEFPVTKKQTNDLVTVTGANGYRKEFREPTLAVSLVPYWKEIPVGEVTVTCRGVTKKFWRQRPFHLGIVSNPPRSCSEAVKIGYEYLINCDNVKSFLKTGKPGDYCLNSYPSKMHAAMINSLLVCAKMMPEQREKAMRAARAMADYLISISQPKGAPLEYFPPTYQGTYAAAKENTGNIMMIYPATAAIAYLKLYDVTGEKKYLEAAERIAATYRRLQGEDGTWQLMMHLSDGAPLFKNRLLPFSVVEMFETLHAKTKREEYGVCAEKALKYIMDRPLKDWNWEGQFEDYAVPNPNKYTNLSLHPAGSMALLLLERWPNDPERVKLAYELVRFCEDQFVCWERPYLAEKKPLWGKAWVEWPVACAVWEQYNYRVPVDSSAGKMIDLYLALYRHSGSPLYLEKARTLVDANIVVQIPDGPIKGMIPTIWNYPKSGCWLNCHAHTISTMARFAEVEAKAAR